MKSVKLTEAEEMAIMLQATRETPFGTHASEFNKKFDELYAAALDAKRAK